MLLLNHATATDTVACPNHEQGCHLRANEQNRTAHLIILIHFLHDQDFFDGAGWDWDWMFFNAVLFFSTGWEYGLSYATTELGWMVSCSICLERNHWTFSQLTCKPLNKWCFWYRHCIRPQFCWNMQSWPCLKSFNVKFDHQSYSTWSLFHMDGEPTHKCRIFWPKLIQLWWNLAFLRI